MEFFRGEGALVQELLLKKIPIFFTASLITKYLLSIGNAQFMSCLECENGHFLWDFSNVGGKTIFHYISNPNFVNFGSGNNHSQVQSKADLCLAHFDLGTHILGASGSMERDERICGPKQGYLNQSAPSKDLLSTKVGNGCSHLVLVRNDQNSQTLVGYRVKHGFSEYV